jgi:eukaryotic-like serine/threonine-protein kinase
VLRTGDELKGYRIVAPLRSGGMARLYLARRDGVAGFSRTAAIKVIHPHLAREPRFVELFIAEARLSSKIEHPNVVRVEDLGEIDGVLFLAMEYVHGVSLGELVASLKARRRRLGFEAVAHIGVRVATALHAAHETTDAKSAKALGIVHCDVSPQNILVSFSGHVKLIDFGVAKALGGAGEASQSSLRGKLAYMAPEQAKGRPLDRRTDVFALGVVLWELLTLERLYEASNDVALLARVQDGVAPSLIERISDVPEALARVVMRALARDPDERHASALEMARALGDAVPASRSLEPDELGSLLVAAVPDEARKRDALLALAAGEDQERAASDPLPTTAARARQETQPSAVFEHLTLPLAAPEESTVVSPPRMPAGAASRGPSRRWAWSLVAAALTLGVWAVAGNRPATAPAVPAPPATDELTVVTASAVASAASEEREPIELDPTATVAALPPKPRAPTPRARPPKSAPGASSLPGPTMHCRLVGGVELCQ